MDERKEGQAKRIKRQKEGMNKVNPASHPSSLPFPLSLSLSLTPFPYTRLHFSSGFSPRRYLAERRQQQKEKKGGRKGWLKVGRTSYGGSLATTR